MWAGNEGEQENIASRREEQDGRRSTNQEFAAVILPGNVMYGSEVLLSHMCMGRVLCLSLREAGTEWGNRGPGKD